MKKNPKNDLLRFLKEDIGKGDLTSDLLPKKIIRAKIISKQNAIVAGVKFAKEIFNLKKCKVKNLVKDGEEIKKNEILLEVTGLAKSVLSCERVVINLLSRMSGIATQ